MHAILAARRECWERAPLMAPSVAAAATLLIATLRAGGTVLACGNGGSATQSSHLVTELVGRFKRERRPLRAVSIPDNAGLLTAVSNDYSYADAFARHVEGLVRPGDALVALSTSGNSENVLRACQAARRAGARVVGLTGAAGGRMTGLCDVLIQAPDDDTPRIQELHLAAIHLLCDFVERALADDGTPS